MGKLYTCENCGHDLRLRVGVNGPFWSCINWYKDAACKSNNRSASQHDAKLLSMDSEALIEFCNTLLAPHGLKIDARQMTLAEKAASLDPGTRFANGADT